MYIWPYIYLGGLGLRSRGFGPYKMPYFFWINWIPNRYRYCLIVVGHQGTNYVLAGRPVKNGFSLPPYVYTLPYEGDVQLIGCRNLIQYYIVVVGIREPGGGNRRGRSRGIIEVSAAWVWSSYTNVVVPNGTVLYIHYKLLIVVMIVMLHVHVLHKDMTLNVYIESHMYVKRSYITKGICYYMDFVVRRRS